MPRIIGVDTSLTRTGLARIDVVGSLPPTIELWSYPSKPVGDQWAARHDRIHELATEVGKAFDGFPTLVVIESPAYSSTTGAVHDRAWFWGQVYHQARERGIPVLTATPQGRMKYATGKGKADKDVVLAAAIKRWPNVDITNNDEADALILAAMGARKLGHPVDDVPLLNQEALAKMKG